MRRLFVPLFMLLITCFSYSGDLVWLQKGYLNNSFASSLSKDERYLAIGYYGVDTKYVVWDIAANKAVYQKQGAPWTQTFALSGDGGLLAYYDYTDQHLKVIDIEKDSFVFDDTLGAYPTGAKFTSDNNSIVLYCWEDSTFNGYAKINITTGSRIYYNMKSKSPDAAPGQKFTLTPDDKYLLTFMNKEKSQYWDTTLVNEVIILNLNNGNIKRLLGHLTNIRAVIPTPDGRKAVSLSDALVYNDPDPRTNFEGKTITWDIESGAVINTVHASKSEPYLDYGFEDVFFNKAGDRIITHAQGRFIKYLEYPSMQMVKFVDLYDQTSGIFPVNDNDVLFTSGIDVKVYSSASDTVFVKDDLRLYKGNMHTQGVGKIAVSPAAEVNNIVASAGYDNLIKLWDAGTGAFITDLRYKNSRVASVAFSPDGQKLAAVYGLPENVVVVWDVQTRKPLYQVDSFNNSLLSVAFSPMGAKIAIGGYEDSLYILNSSTGAKLSVWYAGHWINSVLFTPDGKYIITGAEDDGVKVWDAETGTLVQNGIKNFNGISRSVSDIRLSNDGSLLALACPDGFVRLVETGGWTIIGTYDSRTYHDNVRISMASIVSVCFSDDKKFLYATLASSNLVKAWDLSNGAEYHIYDELYDPTIYYAMSDIVSSADSRYIYSCSQDGSVMKWKGPITLNVVEKLQTDFNIYPNPANDKINLSGLKEIGKIDIYDCKGNLMITCNKPPEPEINISSLPSGSYLISLEADGRTLKSTFSIIR